MANHRSALCPSRHISPSQIAYQHEKLLQDFEALRVHLQNSADGMFMLAPTTASSQLTGTGNTTWNLNIGVGMVAVGAVAKSYDPQVDFSIHAGSYLTGFANGTSCIAAIVAKKVTGTVSIVAVKGTPATTGTQVAPTDAEIQAAVGAGNSWVKLGETTLNRTGDTTVTQSYDQIKRPIPAVTVDLNFGDWSAFA